MPEADSTRSQFSKLAFILDESTTVTPNGRAGTEALAHITIKYTKP